MTNLESAIAKSKEREEKATKVNSWYPHELDGTIRGPFCRWLKVSEIEPQYQKHCGSIGDDTKYAAGAMNWEPKWREMVEVAIPLIKKITILSYENTDALVELNNLLFRFEELAKQGLGE